MLTNERYEVILNLLAEKQTVKITELMEMTDASESTIRRDLTELENFNKLKRIHGGATVSERSTQEFGGLVESSNNLQEKIRLAAFAADFVREEDFIYLDASSTIFQMIPFLKNKNVIIVTNGLRHVESLIEYGITTYLTGGYVKSKTHALVGPQTIQSLSEYRFDKCFLGVSGFHFEYGYSTPDPEEAAVKKLGSTLARKTYVVADHSKYNQISFANIMGLEKAEIVVGNIQQQAIESLRRKTIVNIEGERFQ